jgi:C1A family cysteine protease
VLSGVKKLQSGNPAALREALKDGPVVASINAGNLIFKNYAHGVINTKECGSKFENNDYDHSVLVVGFGDAIKGGPYFVIRNSFGSDWGDAGYAKISAHTTDNKDGTCGILANLYQPIVKQSQLKYNLN